MQGDVLISIYLVICERPNHRTPKPASGEKVVDT